MRRIDPLAVAALVLFVALAVVAVVSAGTGGGPASSGFGRSGSIYDESPGGTSVLRRYLEGVGLTVVPVQGDRFAPSGAGITTLFMLGATDAIEPADLSALHDFVRLGGTLVIASDLGLNERRLLDDFGLSPRGAAIRSGDIAVRSMAFAVPPVRTLNVDYGLGLRPGDDATVLVQSDGTPLVALASEGRGSVFAVGSLAPFVNAGIGLADNGRFVLALAQGAARIGIDEYHHGARPAPEFTALLAQTWLGRALLAMLGLTFVYLVLTGRRLGPPLPLDPRPPRSSLEYVRSFAGLARRSGHGEIARRRLRDDLQRELAKQSGLDPRTDFDRVTNAIATQSPARAAEARRLHQALAGRLRDDALVRAANDVARLIRAEETT
ncbi:MAG: DUF4350 domain-containing protein [Chloroflexota bacterium]|nr:DUF4350 domain-containing protein [Chloroflexota bacterium]